MELQALLLVDLGGVSNGGNGSGGSGNPGGKSGQDGTYYGNNGTGGLLIVFGKNITGSGSFIAKGTDGKNLRYAGYGGGSGGGSINVFYETADLSNITFNSKGGAINAQDGSTSKGSIATGTYVESSE